MDTKYPTLKRPQSKLRYVLNKERPSTQWTGKVSLQDIDKLFDDMDSASADSDDLPPLSPTLNIHSHSEKRQTERATSPVLQEVCLTGKNPSSQKVPQNEAIYPAVRSESPILDIDLDNTFKDHGPIHTSSPIERKVDAEERDCEGDRTASPLLFAFDEDVEEELKREPPPTQTPQCNGQITVTLQGGDDTDLESPPHNFVLSKPKTSTHSRKVAPSSRQGNTGPPVSAVTLEPQYPAQEKSSESELKQALVEKGTRVGTSMATFLQKLKEAGLSKPACPTKPPSPVKVPTPPPELDDDFLIMEAEAPRWFAIPTKTDPNRSKSRQRKTSSTGEEGSTDKVKKDNQSGKAETHPSPGEAGIRSTEEPQTVQRKTKGKKWNAAHEVVSHIPISTTPKMTPGTKMEGLGPEPEVNVDVFSSQEDLPVDDCVKQDKQNIKKQNRCKVSSEEGKAANKAEAQPQKSETTESGETESSVKKTQKKAVESREARRPKASKGGKESPRKRRMKSVKESRGSIQGSGALEEPLPAEAVKEQSQEPSCEEHRDAAPDHQCPPEQDTTPVHCSSSQEITKPKRQKKATPNDPASSKAKQSKPSSGSERESTEEGQQVPGKRKRRKTGEWWRICPMSTEETKEADSEQNHKKNPKGTAHSPIKTVQVGDLEERDQRQSEPSSSQTAEQRAEKGKRAKAVKKRIKSREPRDKTAHPTQTRHNGDLEERDQRQSGLLSSQTAEQKAEKGKRARAVKKRTKSREHWDKTAQTEEVPITVEEQIQDQVEDQDPVQLSPFASPHREHSFTLGKMIFDKMYEKTIKGKLPGALAHTSPKRPPDYIKTPIPEKRRCKPPRNWWKVDEAPEYADSSSSPPRVPSPKNPKAYRAERPQTKPRKSLSLEGPQNGNMAVSPKPGGTKSPQPLLKQKSFSSPKSIRTSLATFKDILNSTIETPIVDNVGNKSQRIGRKMLFPVQEEECTPSIRASDFITGDPAQEPATDCIQFTETDSPLVIMEPARECRNKTNLPTCSLVDLQESKQLSDNTLKCFRSGPASMIELEHYEEYEDLCLPSSKVVRPILSKAELCSPPLVQTELQAQDKANVAKWLKGMWPVIIENGGQVSVDQFEWYAYRSRVLGLLVDMQCDSFSNGKLLLGSYTKKPLWVDHSATSVFNVLTSGVTLTINGEESFYNPGQTFLAPCGHAYSIQNLTREPAVLVFNRMLAESPD